jgi:CBS domain containing-hemolysin-like protein
MAPWPTLLATAALAAVLVWLVQAVPAGLVANAPERAMRILFMPLRAVHVVFAPLIALYNVVAHKRTAKDEEEAELDSIVEEIGEEPAEEEQREMIRGIMDLENTTARMIMAPRMDIIAVEATDEPRTVIDLIGQHGYSRIPIYEETIDNIVGVIYAKDLLRTVGNGSPQSLRDLARKPYFVPESKKVDELLKEFREQRTHIAVVVDEYGGTAGLVTLEDLLEEIVGDIEDEYDQRAEKPIVRLSETEAVFDARVSIDELNDLFETEIEHEGYDTVGGLVYAHLGKIPNAGDEVQVNGLTILVESTIGRRIKRVRAVHTARSETEA